MVRGSVDGSCKAQSEMLNCGCCDAVILDCDKRDGHKGKHSCRIYEYQIEWVKKDQG